MPIVAKMCIAVPLGLWQCWLLVSLILAARGVDSVVGMIFASIPLSIVTVPALVTGLVMAIRRGHRLWIGLAIGGVLLVLYIGYSLSFQGQIIYLG